MCEPLSIYHQNIIYLQAFNQRYLVGLGNQIQNHQIQNKPPDQSEQSHSAVQQPDDGLGNLPKGWGKYILN